jgi:hypothetical protein
MNILLSLASEVTKSGWFNPDATRMVVSGLGAAASSGAKAAAVATAINSVR